MTGSDAHHRDSELPWRPTAGLGSLAMVRPGELDYFDNIGEGGRFHAAGKPFTDVKRSEMFLDVGALLNLLPPPPARLLEFGCGSGWLSWLLARCGYHCVATDAAPAAIDLARRSGPFREGNAPVFTVAEFADARFEAEFDAAIFYSTLHHAEDETAALRSAFRALRSGGTCITIEPGKGHAAGSRHTMEQFGVVERDMPPRVIFAAARAAGFGRMQAFPTPVYLAANFVNPARKPLGAVARYVRYTVGIQRRGAICLLTKT